MGGYFIVAVELVQGGCVIHRSTHKCFKCWWLALPEKRTLTKPLINSTFNHSLPEGPSYPVLIIIKELLRQFKS